MNLKNSLGTGGTKPRSLLNFFARLEFRCREKRYFQSTNCCILEKRHRIEIM